MDWHIVKTQAECDAAVEARMPYIELAAAILVEMRLPYGYVPMVHVGDGGWIQVLAGKVVARGSAHVVAWESAHVVARESAHVVARESAHVVARESAHVVAWESAHVVARGSAHVVARESASLALYGNDVAATAAPAVSAHLHKGAKCDGGVQIVVQEPRTPTEWCEWYGVKVDGESAILFKGVQADFTSPKGALYKPGTLTKAPDWDGGKQECGGGLHLSPAPSMTREFITEPAHFIAVNVRVDSIAVHKNASYPQKVKVPECWNLYECDEFGKQIGERFEQPETLSAKPA